MRLIADGVVQATAEYTRYCKEAVKAWREAGKENLAREEQARRRAVYRGTEDPKFRTRRSVPSVCEKERGSEEASEEQPCRRDVYRGTQDPKSQDDAEGAVSLRKNRGRVRRRVEEQLVGALYRVLKIRNLRLMQKRAVSLRKKRGGLKKARQEHSSGSSTPLTIKTPAEKFQVKLPILFVIFKHIIQARDNNEESAFWKR